MVPNGFQNFIMAIYIWEYAPDTCLYCGLNEGSWCEKGMSWFPFSFVIYLLTFS